MNYREQEARDYLKATGHLDADHMAVGTAVIELAITLKTNERLHQRVKELEAALDEQFVAFNEQFKDAERYRAAIDDAVGDIQIRIWTGGMINDGWEYPRTKAEADAAIDAARETGLRAD